jgi:hypothetical protein
MSVVVTLHINSGRPDPAWELTAQQVVELNARLSRLKTRTLQKPSGMMGGLGYRGFSIVSVREPKLDPRIFVHGNIVDLDRFSLNLVDQDLELEKWLLDSAGARLNPALKQYALDKFTKLRPKALSAAGAGPRVIGDAIAFNVPVFDPGKWNNDPNIQMNNNCYNYANDIITNTFAQPGRGSGAIFTDFTCDSVGSASQNDGQVPSSTPASTPAVGHYMALVIRPVPASVPDFHWYRLDDDGSWSQKHGQAPCTNLDESGNPISSPETCDRGDYSVFCGYYLCDPSIVTIN